MNQGDAGREKEKNDRSITEKDICTASGYHNHCIEKGQGKQKYRRRNLKLEVECKAKRNGIRTKRDKQKTTCSKENRRQ